MASINILKRATVFWNVNSGRNDTGTRLAPNCVLPFSQLGASVRVSASESTGEDTAEGAAGEGEGARPLAVPPAGAALVVDVGAPVGAGGSGRAHVVGVAARDAGAVVPLAAVKALCITILKDENFLSF